jgi:hypothetical protein
VTRFHDTLTESLSMEKGGKSLEEFLNSQMEGRFFDTAEFTLNTLKAREKLAQYQLADSGFWLLKLVQAAVAAGASSVRIGFERNKVLVRFGNTRKWKADEVLREVLAGTTPADPALAHLVTGLRASGATTTETVKWRCGDASVYLGDEGSQVMPQESTSLFELEATRPSRSRSLLGSLTTPLAHLVKQTVEEYEAVLSRCWVCPIPILLDGRELARGYFAPGAGRTDRSYTTRSARWYAGANSVNACLALRPLELPPSRPEMSYQQPEPFAQSDEVYKLNRPLFKNGLFLNWGQQQDVCQAVLAVMYTTSAKAQAEFVHDGVIIKSMAFSDWTPVKSAALNLARSIVPGIGFRLFFAVERKDLDLSEFELRELSLEELLAKVLPATIEVLKAVQDCMSKVLYIPAEKKAAKNISYGLGTSLTAGVVAAKTIAILPAAALFVGSQLGIRTVIWRAALKSHVRDCLKYLEGLLASGPEV